MSNKKLKIGILNLMHDKEDTQNRYDKIFSLINQNIDLKFFYPKTHYLNRAVPKKVSEISEPLNLAQVKNFDGFIVTGAPIEQFAFEDVTYIEEFRCLLQKLNENHTQQLFFCWGAMAALNYYYGIQKNMLNEKVFGVYPHQIFHKDNLLYGIASNFLAPHARYAEMNHEEILQDSRLQIDAITNTGDLFSISSIKSPEQDFIFSHLEYDKEALANEYHREIAAHPEKTFKKPENYSLNNPIFNWKKTQRQFFTNWVKKVDEAKKLKLTLAS